LFAWFSPGRQGRLTLGRRSGIPQTMFERRRSEIADATESALTALLADNPAPGAPVRPPRLLAAMRHAALGGGKRLRPFLVVESAALFGVPMARAIATAAAFECVHCYSLIHDDLPAMDDDDVRRGRPTVHRAFDEATAILAGDALLTLAFDILSRDGTDPDPAVRAELVALLAQASGIHGMAGGQLLDLEAEGRFAVGAPLALDPAAIERLAGMKTGALIGAACAAGAVLGRADAAARRALAGYAHAFGLAFQIADDLLDAEGDPARVGKAVAKDAKAGKATLVQALGRDRAKKRLVSLVEEAERALAPFGARAAMLAHAARFAAERQA
jgi:farnesyl diphosphate synthase